MYMYVQKRSSARCSLDNGRFLVCIEMKLNFSRDRWSRSRPFIYPSALSDWMAAAATFSLYLFGRVRRRRPAYIYSDRHGEIKFFRGVAHELSIAAAPLRWLYLLWIYHCYCCCCCFIHPAFQESLFLFFFSALFCGEWTGRSSFFYYLPAAVAVLSCVYMYRALFQEGDTRFMLMSSFAINRHR